STWPAPSSAPAPSSSTPAPRRPPPACAKLNPALADAEARFKARHGHDPRWAGLAPGRVNLIGEHVDYVGGLVLPAAIDRYVAVVGEPASDWEVESEVEGGRRYLEPLAAELNKGP